MLVSPCQDGGSSGEDLVAAVPMSGWWLLWRGAGGGLPHVGIVIPLGGTWWWLSPHWDGDSSRGDLVVAVPPLGWWFFRRGPGGGPSHAGMVGPPEETWWWTLPQMSFSQHIHAEMS